MAQLDAATGTIDLSRKRPLCEVRQGYTYFANGDVVFAKITPCMENGKSAIANGLSNGIGFGSTEFHVLRPGPRVVPEWLFLHLRSLEFREAARLSMQGAAGQQRVPSDFFATRSIPLPDVSEQRRIVDCVMAVRLRSHELHEVATERLDELDASLRSTYARMVKGVKWAPLDLSASLVRRAIKTAPHSEYEEMGVRSFGKGTFPKPVLTGHQIGNKRIYRIHEGDLVFNNVFAWEGAIAVAQPEDHSRVGSHRFITYVPHEGKATSEFLCQHFLSERGMEDIRAASPGSAGRNRTLGLKKLAKIKVPVPDYEEQIRFAELVKRRQAIQREATAIAEELAAFEGAVIAKAFRGEL